MTTPTSPELDVTMRAVTDYARDNIADAGEWTQDETTRAQQAIQELEVDISAEDEDQFVAEATLAEDAWGDEPAAQRASVAGDQEQGDQEQGDQEEDDDDETEFPEEKRIIRHPPGSAPMPATVLAPVPVPVEQKKTATLTDDCLFCPADITEDEFREGLVGRCPGEAFDDIERSGQTISHGGYVFFHVACGKKAGYCPICTIALSDAWIVRSNSAGALITERWDSPRVVVQGWRSTTVRQSTPQTCYAGAFAAALDGLGQTMENDYEMVHRWAWNEDPYADPKVAAYQQKVRSDRAEHSGDSFAQMLQRIQSWDEWKAIRETDGRPIGSAAPGLGDISNVLRYLPSPSGQQIVEILKGNQVLLAASTSHWQVVYGYTTEANTGAVKALVWDPKGSHKELFLAGDWFQEAFVIQL